ncbi:MAG TPA: hypothetical protein VGV39_04645 [Mesorhizobium sp.]|jgi:hypothetical protein|uniref:hypothetical protein n=1 Tax=Mesorhizobium sp. TaxID=1871066 RepID=UPI002DDC9F07|nr:hypothetical protein [Mesorhizobium sp.]HEV2502337.1 hypothetical protein [Mesorhizobium sp.]
MRVRVVRAAEPIVTPDAIPGSHQPGDASVAALIAAVTETIEGPEGWLGRCLGPQTLEATMRQVCSREIDLLFPPIIPNTVSIKYLDDNGTEQTVPAGNYRMIGNTILFNDSYSFPSVLCAPDAIRIRYEAGYNGAGDGKTGAVPERARQAIILSVQELLRVGRDDHELRSETVEGIGSETYVDSDKIAAVVEKTCDRLLSTLRCYIP